jgi:hypothetical protein
VRCYSARAGEFVDRKVRVTPQRVAIPLDDEVSYHVGAAGECVRRVVARARVYLRGAETRYKFPAWDGRGGKNEPA